MFYLLSIALLLPVIGIREDPFKNVFFSSIENFEIERCYHKKIPRENRLCILVQNMEVEEEVYFF